MWFSFSCIFSACNLNAAFSLSSFELLPHHFPCPLLCALLMFLFINVCRSFFCCAETANPLVPLLHIWLCFCLYGLILAFREFLFFSLEATEYVQSYSPVMKQAKGTHAAPKACFLRFLQDDCLARVLQSGRLSCKTFGNRTIILQGLTRVWQDLARLCVILQHFWRIAVR